MYHQAPNPRCDEAGAGAGDNRAPKTRRLVFSTDPVKVAFDVHRRMRDAFVDVDGRLSINGKFFPSRDISAKGFTVHLVQDSAEVADSTTNQGGEFAFRAVRPGRYAVHLRADRLGITIKPVQLTIHA